jgi:hypothetical protein
MLLSEREGVEVPKSMRGFCKVERWSAVSLLLTFGHQSRMGMVVIEWGQEERTRKEEKKQEVESLRRCDFYTRGV